MPSNLDQSRPGRHTYPSSLTIKFCSFYIFYISSYSWNISKGWYPGKGMLALFWERDKAQVCPGSHWVSTSEGIASGLMGE